MSSREAAPVGSSPPSPPRSGARTCSWSNWPPNWAAPLALLGGGRVWVPANHCPENAGDSPEAALTYLDGLFPARYAHMTDAFVTNAPPHGAVRGGPYPASVRRLRALPGLPPRTAGCDAGRPMPGHGPRQHLPDGAPGAPRPRVPPGYLPMTHAEWERWRYPDRFDWALLRRRERDGIRTNGVGLVASLADGVIRAGARDPGRHPAHRRDVLGTDGRVTAARRSNAAARPSACPPVR